MNFASRLVVAKIRSQNVCSPFACYSGVSVIAKIKFSDSLKIAKSQNVHTRKNLLNYVSHFLSSVFSVAGVVLLISELPCSSVKPNMVETIIVIKLLCCCWCNIECLLKGSV